LKELRLQLLEIQASVERDSEVYPEELRSLAAVVVAAIKGEIDSKDIADWREKLEKLKHKLEPHRGRDRYINAIMGSVGRALEAFSLCAPDDRTVYQYYPELDDVEAPHPEEEGKTIRGPLKCGYGTSLYEFHYEYPIEGAGVRKDLITVVEPDGTRTTIFDWCRENNVVVYCNRCGQEITYEVSLDCPARTRFEC